MIMIATSISWEKPNNTAMGRNTASYPTSFRKVQAISGFGLEKALPNFSAPPIAIRPRGVAVFPRLFTEVLMIAGRGRCKRDHTMPTRIPRIIGLVAMPFRVLTSFAVSSFPPPGAKRESVVTAITLYRGTLPMIIRGAIPALP